MQLNCGRIFKFLTLVFAIGFSMNFNSLQAWRSRKCGGYKPCRYGGYWYGPRYRYYRGYERPYGYGPYDDDYFYGRAAGGLFGVFSDILNIAAHEQYLKDKREVKKARANKKKVVKDNW